MGLNCASWPLATEPDAVDVLGVPVVVGGVVLPLVYVTLSEKLEAYGRDILRVLGGG